jgi:hypothetical protein
MTFIVVVPHMMIGKLKFRSPCIPVPEAGSLRAGYGKKRE